MTRPLFYTAGNFQRFSDSHMEWLAHQLQQAFANQLNNNGQGRVFSGSGNIGSASNTRRLAQSHPASFPGTGAQTVATYNFGQNRTNQGVDFNYDPLYYDPAEVALRRGVNGSFDDELFSTVRSNIISGNELGSYRVAQSSPGTGWVSKGLCYVDTVYNSNQSIPNSIANNNYYLWLKTSGVATPGGEAQAVRFQDELRMDRYRTTDTAMTSFLLPYFANWAEDNIRYTVNTANSATNKGTMIDTRRSGTRNVQFNIDSYVSYPSGNATTYQPYYFHVS